MSGPNSRPSKISDEALLAAVPLATNMRHLLRLLGVAAYGGNYEVVRHRLVLLGVEAAHLRPRTRQWQPATPEALAAAAACSDSWASLSRRLGWGDSPTAQKRAKSQVVEARLDVSHFLGQGWRRGTRDSVRRARPLEEVLVAASRPGSTAGLRRRLLDEGVLAAECSVCGGEEWRGRPIPLELDHVNGDRTDNRLVNLRLLCPNCHAQTPTYRGRNIGAPPAPAPAEPATLLPDRAEASHRRLVLVLAPRTS